MGLSLSSIWCNPILSAGGCTISNKTWQRLGITTVGQIFSDKILPFQHLKNEFGLLQLSSVLSRKCKEGAVPASYSEWDQLFKKASGVVSNIYSLMFRAAYNAYSSVQLAWEHDINTSLTASQWNAIWRKVLSSSKCMRFRIIKYKILSSAYFTPVRLSKMDDNTKIYV